MLLNALLFAAALAAGDAGSPSGQSAQSNDSEFVFSQYPARSLAAGEQGSVKFRVEIDEKGIVQNCKITASSGFKRLDRETCDLIVEQAKFKPVRDGKGIARDAIHDGVVNWRIPGAPAITKTAASTGSGPDKIICKRVEKTGSLVSRSRVCMTAREWSKQADQYQDEYGAIQGRQGSSRSP